MDVKEAVRRAKQYISDLFTDEGAQQVGLEEVEFDGATGTWRVTVGFSRPWDSSNGSPIASVTELMGKYGRRARDMKAVTLDDTDGHIVSVRNRE